MQIDSTSPSPIPDIITLDVGGTHTFRTTKTALSTSPYFANLFDRWEDQAEIQANGSLFVDADGEMFGYLLTYMRRPHRFPLFWSLVAGFDHALYTRLGAEADFFLLEGLRDWIAAQAYVRAVRVMIDVEEHEPLPLDVQKYKEGIARRGAQHGDAAAAAAAAWGGNSVVQTLVVKGGLQRKCPSGRHTAWNEENCLLDDACQYALEGNGYFNPYAVDKVHDDDALVSVVTRYELDGAALVNDGQP